MQLNRLQKHLSPMRRHVNSPTPVLGLSFSHSTCLIIFAIIIAVMVFTGVAILTRLYVRYVKCCLYAACSIQLIQRLATIVPGICPALSLGRALWIACRQIPSERHCHQSGNTPRTSQLSLDSRRTSAKYCMGVSQQETTQTSS